jgi:hypothetical protein
MTRALQDLSNSDISTNTFLLIDSDVMQSFDQPFHAWIWSYETNFVPSANSITTLDNKKYEGRMKMAMSSLFTWFYAARKEEINSMVLF